MFFRLRNGFRFQAPLRRPRVLVGVVWLLAFWTALPAFAHVGSKDVFEQTRSGPYQFFVTVRPPTVVPGVAVVEVRVTGPAVHSLSLTPVPLTGEASLHPPTPDRMQRSAADPAFFTGSVWLMAPGSWQVRLQAEGDGGAAKTSVPVPAMALSVQRMQRPLGLVLGLLGLVLVGGMAGIIYGAVREARLKPGRLPTPARTYRATLAAGVTLVLLVLAGWAGDRWWNVEAAAYSSQVFQPLHLRPTLAGNMLKLQIDPGTPDKEGRARPNDDLLLDHGHPMHLYAIRWPEMDAVYHLHPVRGGAGMLFETLPSMPPGDYHLYADIVHRNGFPETLTATLTVPPDASHNFLEGEDASAYPAPLRQGELGTRYHLPDNYTMVWNRPATLTANTAESFDFQLLDPHGRPATDMRPYLGMAGHAAFVKVDGSVFAHTHPEGSAAMPAMMLANADGGMEGMAETGPLSPEVTFPYGFPSAGRYRIFIQMKHGEVVETGVFDAQVQ